MTNVFKKFRELKCCNTNGNSCGGKKKLCYLVRHTLLCAIISTLILLTFGPFVIKKTISQNPMELLVKPLDNLRKSEMEKVSQNIEKTAKDFYQSAQNNKDLGFIGSNSNSKVVIEFFDYNCGYCSMQAKEFKKLLKKRTDIKYILINMPILSKTSYEAAMVAIHLNQINPKALDTYYETLITTKANDINSIKNALIEAKVPQVDKVIKDALDSKTSKEQLKENYEVAQSLDLKGTPALIINGKLIAGFLKSEEIEKLFEENK